MNKKERSKSETWDAPTLRGHKIKRNPLRKATRSNHGGRIEKTWSQATTKAGISV